MTVRMLRVTAMFAAVFAMPASLWAQPVAIRVTVQNLAPTNSVSFAPLLFGFHNGTFDAFNNGQPATAPIISVAEGGSGSAWFPAFAAAEPNATLGAIGGALFPGQTASGVYVIDPAVNRFFTFGSMVIPSNDHFIGNDSPTQFQVLDTNGNLLINTISQQADDIWDAGSELFDPANAAFLTIGNNDLRTPQNGVVNFNFSELSGYNGLTTAAGYVFNSQLSAGTDIYQVQFQVVPEPTSLALTALLPAGWAFTRRFRRQTPSDASVDATPATNC